MNPGEMREIATIAKEVKSKFHATGKVTNNNSSTNVERPSSALFPMSQVGHHDSTEEDGGKNRNMKIKTNTLQIDDGPRSVKSGPRSHGLVAISDRHDPSA